MYAPLNYESLNGMIPLQTPTSVNLSNNQTANMFERYMYFRLMSVYDWTIPDNWDLEYLQYCLYSRGYVAVLKTPEYGIVPQAALAFGFNLYYNPNRFNVVSPILQLIDQEIGKDGEILRMTPDWCGMADLIRFFAEKQALNSQAIDMSLINSKVAFILAGKNKAAARALEVIMDRINRGEPAVSADKEILADDMGNESIYVFNRDVKQSFILPELLQAFRELDRIVDELLGIPSVGTEKKERLTNEEVNANNGKTRSLAYTMLRQMKDSIKAITKLYPELEGKLDVKYAYDEEQTQTQEGDDNADV